MSNRPLHVLVGPPDHGVVRFGRVLAGAMGADVLWAGGPAAVSAGTGQTPRPAVHLHYTDALYAARTGPAAAAFADLCARLRRHHGGPVTVTLHDVPDPGDEPGRWLRRAAAYRRVVRCVDAAVVSSVHEKCRLESAFAMPVRCFPTPVAVLPLPVDAGGRAPAAPGGAPRREVAVFGFVYPGKGHDEVLRALTGLPRGVDFTVLGRAAAGHEHLPARLAELAEAQGRRCRVEGFVPDELLVDRLRRVAVPVVPGRTVSASGSLNSWIAAGRRPLVAAGPYAREMAARFPPGLRLYHPQELPGLVREALADPSRTWRDAAVPQSLLLPAVAAGYARVTAAARARRVA